MDLHERWSGTRLDRVRQRAEKGIFDDSLFCHDASVRTAFLSMCIAGKEDRETAEVFAQRQMRCLALMQRLTDHCGSVLLQRDRSRGFAEALSAGLELLVDHLLKTFDYDINQEVVLYEPICDPEEHGYDQVRYLPLELALNNVQILRTLLKNPALNVNANLSSGFPALLHVVSKVRPYRDDLGHQLAVLQCIMGDPRTKFTGVWKTLFCSIRGNCKVPRHRNQPCPWVPVVRCLLGHPGCRGIIDERDGSGTSFFLSNVSCMCCELLNLFAEVEQRSLFSERDSSGNGVWHYSVKAIHKHPTCENRLDHFRVIADTGQADVNFRNNEGWTALMCIEGSIDLNDAHGYETSYLKLCRDALVGHGAISIPIAQMDFRVEGQLRQIKKFRCMEASEVFRAYFATDVGRPTKRVRITKKAPAKCFEMVDASCASFNFMKAFIEKKPLPPLTIEDGQLVQDLLALSDTYMIHALNDHLATELERWMRSEPEDRVIKFIGEIELYLNRFFAARLGSAALPPSVKVLRDQGCHARAAAKVLAMAGRNDFEVEELIQNSWSCARRHCSSPIRVEFARHGRCTVRGEQVAYEVVPNTHGNGAYARNATRLYIRGGGLESDPFFCCGRSNFQPVFRQNWKHETDYVLSVAGASSPS